jgi:hypothetical protein
MRRTNDIFVSVNPNSPRKQRRKKLTSYGQVIHFGSTSTVSDSLGSAHIPDENQPNAVLGSPWTPLPTFRSWDLSTRTGSGLETPSVASAPSDVFTSDTAENNSLTSCALGEYEIPERLSHVEPESSPVLLKLRKSANSLDGTLEASHLRIYDTPTLTPQNAWRACKRDVLKMISDASRSPLDLIADILDPSQDEHEQYRS